MAYIGDAIPELAPLGRGGRESRRAHAPRWIIPRAAKTPYELACLREANRLGARGHIAAAAAFRAGASEFGIELAFLRPAGCASRNCPTTPSSPLNEAAPCCTTGAGSGAPPQRAFAADRCGRGVRRLRQGHHPHLFAARKCRLRRPHRAHGRACSRRCARRCAPGVEWRDDPSAAHQLTARVLREADIITVQRRRGGRKRGLGRVPAARHRAPARTGGARRGRLHALRGGRRHCATGGAPVPAPHAACWRAGFVVTMEPGIYFIDQLLDAARADARGGHINWARVGQLRRFGGIRIEDDLAVSRGGCENLTRDAFRRTDPAARIRAPWRAGPEISVSAACSISAARSAAVRRRGAGGADASGG